MALARQTGRPYLELHGLAHGAHAMLLVRPEAPQAEWSWQAIELAERHGWGAEPLAGVAYAQLGIVSLYQGRLDEAEPWLERAERTLRAEDITESSGILLPFLLDPAPALLERQRRYSAAHPALISQILDLLRGTTRSAPPPGSQPGWARSPSRDEQLTDSETRVLRYLPTHLTGHEIADELFLSVNTVGTHLRHLYAKLGAHSRHEAVARARALGLLAPSARTA